MDDFIRELFRLEFNNYSAPDNFMPMLWEKIRGQM